MRTGHSGAALAWTTGGLASILWLIGGTIIALNVTVGASAPPILLGVLGLLGCGIGTTIHAHDAVRQWDKPTERKNFQQWLAWQRDADQQRAESYCRHQQ